MRCGIGTVLVLLVAGCGGEQTSSGDGVDASALSKSLMAQLSADDHSVSARAVRLVEAWYDDVGDDGVAQIEARDALIPALDGLAKITASHANPHARLQAVWLLAELGYRALPAVDALVTATRAKGHIDLRKQAVKGLGRVASPRQGLFSRIRRDLRQFARHAVKMARPKWNPDDPGATFGTLYVEARDKALVAVMHAIKTDASRAVVAAAIHELGSWGSDATHLVPEVLRYLRSKDFNLSSSALYTIRALKPPAAQVLQPYLDFIDGCDRDKLRGRVRIEGAILGLAELGAGGVPAIDFLVKLSRDSRLEGSVNKALATIEAAQVAASGK